MQRVRIVIIGGGPGGYEAALVAAEQGADVTVVSREGLGGSSVLWDCVPSKAMIVSADAMGWVEGADRLGVRMADGSHVAEGVRCDLAAVMDRVQRLAHTQSGDIERKVERSGARIVPGTGRLAGRDAVEVESADGRTTVVPADVILVATGSVPRTLPFARPDGERVFTSRELFALRELPERLVVIGSGVTGAEYAQCFNGFGAEVHLVSSRDQILPSEDPDAAKVLEDAFEQRGMVIHRQRRAMDLERTADGVRVRIAPDDAPDELEDVEGSHVLLCVGMVPASRRLGLEAAGVEIDDRGFVPVDAVSRTNVRTVYAAGDVTGRVMLASVAAMQGRVAMWHALGMAVAPLRWDAVASTIFTRPQVATVGMSAVDADAAHLPTTTLSLDLAGNPRAKMERATRGFIKITALKGSGTIVGAAVVAERASDLIHPLSVAVHNRLTVDQVAHAFTVYPSLSGSVAETARQLAAREDALLGT